MPKHTFNEYTLIRTRLAAINPYIHPSKSLNRFRLFYELVFPN